MNLKYEMQIAYESLKNRRDIKGIRQKNQNPDNGRSYYIIKRATPYTGIFSNILTFLSHIRYAEENGLIPIIDMQHFANEYLSEVELGGINAWEYYFEQPIKDTKLEDAYASKSSRLSVGEFRKGYEPSKEFLASHPSGDFMTWKHLYEQYIRLNEETTNYIDSRFLNEFTFDKDTTLGVLCRGSDYFFLTDEQKGSFDNLAQVVSRVNRIMDTFELKNIYLVTEDQRVLEYFIDIYGDRLFYNRSERRISDCEGRLNGHIWKEMGVDLRQKGLDYIFNIYSLSKMKYFIGTRTSATVFLPIIADYNFSYYYDLNTIEEDDIQFKNL